VRFVNISALLVFFDYFLFVIKTAVDLKTLKIDKTDFPMFLPIWFAELVDYIGISFIITGQRTLFVPTTFLNSIDFDLSYMKFISGCFKKYKTINGFEVDELFYWNSRVGCEEVMLEYSLSFEKLRRCNFIVPEFRLYMYEFRHMIHLLEEWYFQHESTTNPVYKAILYDLRCMKVKVYNVGSSTLYSRDETEELSAAGDEGLTRLSYERTFSSIIDEILSLG
jgi:hypothetical protein